MKDLEMKGMLKRPENSEVIEKIKIHEMTKYYRMKELLHKLRKDFYDKEKFAFLHSKHTRSQLVSASIVAVRVLSLCLCFVIIS